MNFNNARLDTHSKHGFVCVCVYVCVVAGGVVPALQIWFYVGETGDPGSKNGSIYTPEICSQESPPQPSMCAWV